MESLESLESSASLETDIDLIGSGDSFFPVKLNGKIMKLIDEKFNFNELKDFELRSISYYSETGMFPITKSIHFQDIYQLAFKLKINFSDELIYDCDDSKVDEIIEKLNNEYDRICMQKELDQEADQYEKETYPKDEVYEDDFNLIEESSSEIDDDYPDPFDDKYSNTVYDNHSIYPSHQQMNVFGSNSLQDPAGN